MRSKHYGGVWGVGYGVENGDVEVGPPRTPHGIWHLLWGRDEGRRGSQGQDVVDSRTSRT